MIYPRPTLASNNFLTVLSLIIIRTIYFDLPSSDEFASSDESFEQDVWHWEIDFKDVDLINSSDDGKSLDEEPSPDEFPSSDESFAQDAGHGEIDFKDVDLTNSSDDVKSSDEEPSPDEFASSDESFGQEDAGHGVIDF